MANRTPSTHKAAGNGLHMKSALALIWVIACSSTASAQRSSAPVEEGLSSGDVLAYAVFLVAGASILVSMFMLFKKSRLAISQQTAEAAAQEMAFADRLIQEMGGDPTEGLPARPAFDIKAGITADSPVKPYQTQPMRVPPPFQGPSATPGLQAAKPPLPAGVAARVDAPATDVEDLVRRLMSLNVLGDREGVFPLAVPPAAPIHRIRRGGVAVVLPRMESEAVMAHLVNRFDIVFAMTGGGEVLVLSRLQTRLVELMDNPGAGSSGR